MNQENTKKSEFMESDSVVIKQSKNLYILKGFNKIKALVFRFENLTPCNLFCWSDSSAILLFQPLGDTMTEPLPANLNYKKKDELVGIDLKISKIILNIPTKYGVQTAYIFMLDGKKCFTYGGEILDKQGIEQGMTIRLRYVEDAERPYFVATGPEIQN